MKLSVAQNQTWSLSASPAHPTRPPPVVPGRSSAPWLAPLHGAAGTGAAAPAPMVSTKPGYIKFNYHTWLPCTAFYLQISKCFLSIKQTSQCPLPSSCRRVCYTRPCIYFKCYREKLRCRDGKRLAQNHPTRQWQSRMQK